MLQCFTRPQNGSLFCENQTPRMVYICSTEPAATIYPRLMHRHDTLMEVFFITEGEGVHIIGDRRYNTKGGDILVYNSGMLHYEHAVEENPMKGFCCGISGLKLYGLPENHLLPAWQAQVIPSGDQFNIIRELLDSMFAQANSGHKEASELCNRLTACLVILILQSNRLSAIDTPVDKSKTYQLYQSIKQLLDHHYMEEISLQKIADKFNMSQHYLSHLFKEATGFSPINYLIHRRLGEAQSLLINTDNSVTHIAGLVGYDSANHFNTQFKKVIGTSPQKFRRYWIDNNSKYYK